MTQENSAKDIYSKIMSYKAEAGIKSSFTELTEAEARKIFDIGWDANLFYPTTSSNAFYKLKKLSEKKIKTLS